MTTELQRLLERIEADTGEDVGRHFIAVAARYFAESRVGGRGVSTSRDPDSLQQLFSGDLPERGGRLDSVLERVDRDVVRESNWLYHPRSMGHQVSAPLPAAVGRKSSSAP